MKRGKKGKDGPATQRDGGFLVANTAQGLVGSGKEVMPPAEGSTYSLGPRQRGQRVIMGRRLHWKPVFKIKRRWTKVD